ncbi:MAG: hypothetical protein ABJI14_03100 [Marinomonas sp.]
MKHEANALMERALQLLDIAKEDLTAAKLDDAICSLNIRKPQPQETSEPEDQTTSSANND